MSEIWIVFLELVLPFVVVEVIAMVFWRWIVVEGRWFGRPQLDEINPEAVAELQDDVAQLTQRVIELEEMLS